MSFESELRESLRRKQPPSDFTSNVMRAISQRQQRPAPARRWPAIAAAFLRAAWARPNEVVTSTRQLEDEALDQWIERYDDQRFSLADAVSFVVMKDRGIRDALTLDKHFAIAGFTMLP